MSTKPPSSTTKFADSLVMFFTATTLVLVCIRYVDVPLATLVEQRELPRVIHKLLDAAEHFGTPYGNALIFLLIALMDPPRCRYVACIALAAWSAGLASDLIKLLVPRTRPKYVDFSGPVMDFGFLDPTCGLRFDSHVQSFPSSHTATAVAFCLALTHLYPNGRSAFAFLALLVGLQRIETSSHFASDVCVGAFIGWLIGRAFFVDASASDKAQSRRIDVVESFTRAEGGCWPS